MDRSDSDDDEEENIVLNENTIVVYIPPASVDAVSFVRRNGGGQCGFNVSIHHASTHGKFIVSSRKR